MASPVRKYWALTRSTVGGGFPPDYVFWGHKKNIGIFEFSGAWSKPRKGKYSSSVIHQAFYQAWDWTDTTNLSVTKPYHSPDEIYTSKDGVKYKIVGFRDTGGYKYVENTWEPWTGKPTQVTHTRESYVLIVEIVEDPRKKTIPDMEN